MEGLNVFHSKAVVPVKHSTVNRMVAASETERGGHIDGRVSRVLGYRGILHIAIVTRIFALSNLVRSCFSNLGCLLRRLCLAIDKYTA